jgi:hypothetical protein
MGCSTTVQGGIDPEFVHSALLQLAKLTLAPFFAEDEIVIEAASSWWEDEDHTQGTLSWTDGVRVQIDGFTQVVRSWLTMAGDVDEYQNAREDSGMRWVLTLALVSAFSLPDFTAVTLNTISDDAARRRRLQEAATRAVHINYTVVSIDDISTVVQASHFVSHLQDSLELAAFHYEVALPPDVLLGVGTNSEVETTLEYSFSVPVDLRQHDTGLVEHALRQVLADPNAMSAILGNVSVLASRVGAVEVLDLSGVRNATQLPQPPPPSDPIAVVVMTLLLVAGGVGAFFFLLYRACLPVYRSSRVVPSSRYEWTDPNKPKEDADNDAKSKSQDKDMRSISFGPTQKPR